MFVLNFLMIALEMKKAEQMFSRRDGFVRANIRSAVGAARV